MLVGGSRTSIEKRDTIIGVFLQLGGGEKRRGSIYQFTYTKDVSTSLAISTGEDGGGIKLDEWGKRERKKGGRSGFFMELWCRKGRTERTSHYPAEK